MNSSPPTERVQQLLEVVEQQRDRRCAEILERAHTEARELVKQARGQARSRLHHEILQAREQFSHQLVLQQASQASTRRQARYGADRVLLDQCREPLRAALERRWQETASRRLWVETLTAQARARLVQTDWRIEHPLDWPAAEREETGRRLRQELGTEPGFVAEPSLHAGIRVRAGDTLVDGSCEGLLRDRVHIEALLLAAVRKAAHG